MFLINCQMFWVLLVIHEGLLLNGHLNCFTLYYNTLIPYQPPCIVPNGNVSGNGNGNWNGNGNGNDNGYGNDNDNDNDNDNGKDNENDNHNENGWQVQTLYKQHEMNTLTILDFFLSVIILFVISLSSLSLEASLVASSWSIAQMQAYFPPRSWKCSLIMEAMTWSLWAYFPSGSCKFYLIVESMNRSL